MSGLHLPFGPNLKRLLDPILELNEFAACRIKYVVSNVSDWLASGFPLDTR